MITLLLIALLHDHFTFSCLFVFKTNISNINCVICYLIGYSGVKCETASATVPPTTPKAFSCSDCLAPGTEYCAFINNAMSCKCKQGKQYGQKNDIQGCKQLRHLMEFHVFILHLGYSGPKCGIFISTTITTPVALKCSDCSTVGTEYCSLVNGAFQCKCKTGKRY